ncbi:hypothetical protein LCGC14_2362570, partial [marine sediment metagenome]
MLLDIAGQRDHRVPGGKPCPATYDSDLQAHDIVRGDHVGGFEHGLQFRDFGLVVFHRRLNIALQPAPKQDPAQRVKNWDEAFLGYELDTAIIEAERCIHCPTAPCQEACPVENDIPGALLLLEEGDLNAAANVFRETSTLPEMCGRLCPQESLCEGACVVGFAIRTADMGRQPPVAIGKLESFFTDQQRRNEGFPMPELSPPSDKKVAIVGSG